MSLLSEIKDVCNDNKQSFTDWTEVSRMAREITQKIQNKGRILQ